MAHAGEEAPARKRRGAAGLAVLLSIAACGEILGVEELTMVSADYASEACRACIADSCKDAELACLLDADCRARYGCVAACPLDDAGCAGACIDYAPFAHGELFRAVDACRYDACPGECIATAGLFRAASVACDACMVDKCPQQMAACLSSASCSAGMSCRTGCDDPDCHYYCKTFAEDPSEGECLDFDPAKYSIYGCLQGACGEPCEVGTSWECKGDYAWIATSGTAERRFRVVELLYPDKGVAGVDIDVCLPTDPACDDPLATTATDDDGYACLSLPAPAGAGFLGYLRLRSPGQPDNFIYLKDRATQDQGQSETALVKTADVTWVGTKLEEWVGDAHVMVVVNDCRTLPAPGVMLTLTGSDGMEKPFYLDLAQLIADPEASQTDESGSGGWIGVAPDRDLLIQAWVGDDLVAQRQVRSRHGITQVYMSPLTR